MWGIDNAPTSDQYTDAATLICDGAPAVTVYVRNAQVYYQAQIATAGVKPGGEVWQPERLLYPGNHNFTAEGDFRGGACHGMRFRSYLPGTPAIVTASA